ncbi:MAG: fumarylacetoacetate hydrolase family protein [Granulosicoccus sp.]|nr:fumarylacetoacetate hydrolase family protein [Granulosicoccus sp.]
MKLVRFGPAGAEKPGLMHDGEIRDLSAHVDDIDGSTLDANSLARLASIDPASLPLVDGATRLGPPIGKVGKVICVGLNYTDHAEESGMPIPAEPVLFMKSTTSICGPNDDVVIPRNSTKLDWEVELGIVIGKKASYVDESDALDYVAGYTVVNDVSERAFQIDGTGQWVKGKSADTFCPFGPCITTTDAIPDPQVLDVWLDVDGERLQTGNTRTMIFSVAHIVSYISQHMTLLPGDLIPTGTPPGVGLGFKPPRFLSAGNVMSLGIEGIGDIRQTVKPFSQA